MNHPTKLALLGGVHLVASAASFKIALDGATGILHGAPVGLGFRVWQFLAAVLCFPFVDMMYLVSPSFPWAFPAVLGPFVLNSAAWVLGAAAIRRMLLNRRGQAA
jgi:hypothetical protein